MTLDPQRDHATQPAPPVRRAQPSASTVVVRYAPGEAAPSAQEERLERTLGRLFPDGCGVPVFVDVAWSETHRAWNLRSGQAMLGGQQLDITSSLRETCRVAGVPLVSRSHA